MKRASWVDILDSFPLQSLIIIGNNVSRWRLNTARALYLARLLENISELVEFSEVNLQLSSTG